jgi:hypothetical protein
MKQVISFTILFFINDKQQQQFPLNNETYLGKLSDLKSLNKCLVLLKLIQGNNKAIGILHKRKKSQLLKQKS